MTDLGGALRSRVMGMCLLWVPMLGMEWQERIRVVYMSMIGVAIIGLSGAGY